MAKNNTALRRCIDRPEIALLSNGLTGITGAWFHIGREILDCKDFILREHQVAELGEIEPAIRRVSDGSIIEVEAIHINICFALHAPSIKSRSRPKTASRPAPKRQG